MYKESLILSILKATVVFAASLTRTSAFSFVHHLLLIFIHGPPSICRWWPGSAGIGACRGPSRSSQTVRRTCWKLRMRNTLRSGCSASTWPSLRPERGRTERLPPTCESNTDTDTNVDTWPNIRAHVRLQTHTNMSNMFSCKAFKIKTPQLLRMVC